jgi:polysaccharide pyruvyl transferase WcaK-like protein
VVTAPIGIGPFASEHWKDRAVHALRRMDLTVRDKVSFEFCRAHGVTAKLAPDDAFAWIKKLPAPARDEKPAGPRKIGVCIFPQYNLAKDRDLTGWWVECLRGLVAQHPGHEIEGFCFHTSRDDEYGEMKKLFALAGLPPENVLEPVEDFRRAVDGLRDYQLIITARFHATITANVFSIPNIAIASSGYYQAKMQAAATGYEAFSDVIDPGEASPKAMLALCDKKLAGRSTG